MINLNINGLQVSVEDGMTILEAAQFLGFPIPTLCHMEGLSPYGACRLCIVEIGDRENAKIVTSCTHPVIEGMKVRTTTNRIQRARNIILELHLASCPQSKTIQDLASAHQITQQRFKQENEKCIMCGRCVRMCKEQMTGDAIGFRGRGETRSIGTPFDIKSDKCRLCGGCIYVCPACELRCTYTDTDSPICGGCANLAPPCLKKEKFDDMMCYMEPCVACEIK